MDFKAVQSRCAAQLDKQQTRGDHLKLNQVGRGLLPLVATARRGTSSSGSAQETARRVQITTCKPVASLGAVYMTPKFPISPSKQFYSCKKGAKSSQAGGLEEYSYA